MNRIELDESIQQVHEDSAQGSLSFVNILHLEAEELLIDFSDGTSARFSAGQLAALQPVRDTWNCEED